MNKLLSLILLLPLLVALPSEARKKKNADTPPSAEKSTTQNGLFHAALDGTGYMSVETESWISWNIEAEESAEYDVFIVYEPENNDKKYSVRCNGAELSLSLPGVDRMLQTAYFGTMKIEKGPNEFVLDQTERCNPLENIGLKLNKILLRRK